ncbi:MAG: hypothetical protein IJ932_05020 [Ruminococcus sp.]|nr:hypothetical protein [Ruminococcus sp.]
MKLLAVNNGNKRGRALPTDKAYVTCTKKNVTVDIKSAVTFCYIILLLS